MHSMSKTAKQLISLEEVSNEISTILVKRQRSLAVAESVTAGNLQAAFALAENASLFFQGGMTVYNLGQKCRQLDIEPIHAATCNCVSQKVSDRLALNIADKFLAYYGIGITGYAAPYPPEKITNLYAYVSVTAEGKVIAAKKLAAPKQSPARVQEYYTRSVLQLFLDMLSTS